jgi:hypothetical protein
MKNKFALSFLALALVFGMGSLVYAHSTTPYAYADLSWSDKGSYISVDGDHSGGDLEASDCENFDLYGYLYRDGSIQDNTDTTNTSGCGTKYLDTSGIEQYAGTWEAYTYIFARYSDGHGESDTHSDSQYLECSGTCAQ